MIKAEVIEYPGTEVPNWVNKCRDVLTSAPAIGAVAILVIAIGGIGLWHGSRPAYTSSTEVQSQPAVSSSLQVMPLGTSPATPESSLAPAQTSSPASAPIPSSATSVGPAPASSLNNLQPSGQSQQAAPSLTQAATQTIQSAGKATLDSLQNLGL